jgi:HK97 gp10 family phage protein
MIKGSVKGVEKTLKAAKAAAKIFEDNRANAVKESTLRLHEEAVKIVSANEGGSSAVRYGPKRNVSVSKPGDPPHTDTGRLRQSIKFNYKDGIGQVGSNLKYAAWLEFGTEDMRPRPWLSTAVSNVSKIVPEIFEKWFNNAIKEIKK